MSLAADIVPPALIAIYALLSIVFRWKPEIPIFAAFLLLIATGITFASGAQGVADHLGFSVFYLIVAGAILLVIRHIRERRRGK